MASPRATELFDGVRVANDADPTKAFEQAKSLCNEGAGCDVLRAAQLLHFAASRSVSGAEEAFAALQTNALPDGADSHTVEDIWDACCMALDQDDSAAAAQVAGWYQVGLADAVPQSDALCAAWLYLSATNGSANSMIFLGIHTLAEKLPSEGSPCSASDAVLGMRLAVQESLAAAAAVGSNSSSALVRHFPQQASGSALARGLAALAMAHESGQYVPKDLVRSHAFRVLASTHGIDGSMQHAQRIYDSLPGDTQREQADMLSQALVEMGAEQLQAAAAIYTSRPTQAAGNADGQAGEAAASAPPSEDNTDSEFCFFLLTMAALRGHADSLFRWGFSLQKGSFGSFKMEKDPDRAFQLLSQAAHKGHTLAARTCGDMTAHGIGVPRDEDAAAKWYATAASGGDQGFAAVKVAVRELRTAAKAEKAAQTTHSGDAASYVSTDALSSALETLQRFAEDEQSSTACQELVAYFDREAPNYEPPLQPRGGVRQAGKHAVKYLTIAAHAGNDTCAAKGARRLLRGEGVPPNGPAAEQLLRAAAANGHDQSMRALHVAYAHQLYGQLIPASEQKLEQLAGLAFDAARGEVVMLIANTFNHGTDFIPENEVAALRVFELALQLGEGGAAEAMFPLLLQGGAGHATDKPAALQVIRRGHALGNDACGEWLAECLWSALLGERDCATALSLWREQAATGNEFSALRLYVAEREADIEAFHTDARSNDELQQRADDGDAEAAWTLCKRDLSGQGGNDSDMQTALSAARRTAELGGDITVHAVLAALAETAEEEEAGSEGEEDDDSVDGSGTRVLALRTAELQRGIAAGCPMAHYSMGELLATPTNVATQHVQRIDVAKEHFQAARDGGVLFAQQRLDAVLAAQQHK